MNKVILCICVVVCLLMSTAVLAVDQTLTLKNLERERAALIHDMFDPSLDMQKRAKQITKRQRHLTDMERMVMRDERLLKANTPLVQQAFRNYDTTFLVHAGAEQSRSAAEQWLVKVKLSNQLILNTQSGFRK